MIAFAGRRAVLAVAVAFTVSLIAFLTVHLSGDVALSLAGDNASSEDVERIRQLYGLDRSLASQYIDWLVDAVQGNFGTSLMYRLPVLDLVIEKLPVTVWLALASLCLALAISLPLGILAAIYANSWIDRAALLLAVSGQALPNFFFALVLIMLFSIELR